MTWGVRDVRAGFKGWVLKLGLNGCRHSRLGGSQDLEVWARAGGDSVREAYKEHLMGPIIAVKDELFKTFRQVSPPSMYFLLNFYNACTFGFMYTWLFCRDLFSCREPHPQAANVLVPLYSRMLAVAVVSIIGFFVW